MLSKVNRLVQDMQATWIAAERNKFIEEVDAAIAAAGYPTELVGYEFLPGGRVEIDWPVMGQRHGWWSQEFRLAEGAAKAAAQVIYVINRDMEAAE